MKQQFLLKMYKSFRVAFLVGAALSFLVYFFARILFYEFTFTAKEEVINFFTIILSGGILVSLAVIIFLLLEVVLNYLGTLKISLPVVNVGIGVNKMEVDDYPMVEMKTSA